MQLHPGDYLPGEETAEKRRRADVVRESDQQIVDEMMRKWDEGIGMGSARGQEGESIGVERPGTVGGAEGSLPPETGSGGEMF